MAGDDLTSMLAARLRRMERSTRDGARLDRFAKYGSSVTWPEILDRLPAPAPNLLSNPYAVPGGEPWPGDYTMTDTWYGWWDESSTSSGWTGDHGWTMQQSVSGIFSTPSVVTTWAAETAAVMTDESYDPDAGLTGKERLLSCLQVAVDPSWDTATSDFVRIYPEPVATLPTVTPGVTYRVSVQCHLTQGYSDVPGSTYGLRVGVEWRDSGGSVLTTALGAEVSPEGSMAQTSPLPGVPRIYYRNDSGPLASEPVRYYGAVPTADLAAPSGAAKGRPFVDLRVDDRLWSLSDFQMRAVS